MNEINENICFCLISDRYGYTKEQVLLKYSIFYEKCNNDQKDNKTADIEKLKSIDEDINYYIFYLTRELESLAILQSMYHKDVIFKSLVYKRI